MFLLPRQLLKQPDQDLQSLEVCHTAPLAQGMCQPAPFTHVGAPVQGVGRLTLSFQQLAVAAMSIGAIHTLQAASVHPPITKIAAGLFFLVGGATPQVCQHLDNLEVWLDLLQVLGIIQGLTTCAADLG